MFEVPSGYGDAIALTTFDGNNGSNPQAGLISNGAYPYASLIMDAAGDLYGTTSQGGAHNGIRDHKCRLRGQRAPNPGDCGSCRPGLREIGTRDWRTLLSKLARIRGEARTPAQPLTRRSGKLACARKSAKRFSDKDARQNKNLEPAFDSIKSG